MKPKLIRVSTVPISLATFCNGFLKELSNEYEVVALSSHGEELNMIEKREGVRIVAVDMARHISLKNDIVSLYRLIKVFRKENPQIVHSITPKAGLLCMLAAWFVRVPLRVHTFTGLVFPTSHGLKRKILMLTDWITCACATHIIPEGEGVKEDLIKNGITKKDLKVLGYGNVRGVDMKHYDRTKLVMDEAMKIRIPSVFTFIFIGRLVCDKGINELVSASTSLYNEGFKFRVLLVGSFEDDLDPLFPETKNIIFNSEYINYVGIKKDVRPWLAASDALVFPSYREGFPNVVLEAGAMGLPSIVTDINGSREIIRQDYNGVIIPVRNTKALYEAMKDFLVNSEKVNQMALKARNLIEEHYEQGFVRQCQRAFYKRILADCKKY